MKMASFVLALAKWQAARLLLGLAAAVGLAGCATLLPHPTSVTEPRGVFVWPMAACPSNPVSEPALLPALATAVATPILIDVVSGLIGMPVAALQSAAAADKNGFSVTTMNPVMFFSKAKKDSAGSLQFSLPKCYVVAYTSKVAITSGISDASRWCDDPGFKKTLDVACPTDGRKSLLTKLDPIGDMSPVYGLAVPDAYFEIQIDTEVYHNSSVAIAQPKVLAMYYPRSLIEPSSDKPRAITLTLTHTPVVGGDKDPTRVTSIGVYLPHVVPKADDTKFAEALANQQSSWTAFPTAVTVNNTDTQPDGQSYYPVTISASLKELGAPHAFLQAFSAAFSSGTADLAKSVVNNISPAAQATSDQQSQTNQAAYYAAVATAATDLGKLIGACTPTPTTDAGKATAEAAFNAVKGDRAKANAAALAAGMGVQFDDLELGLNRCSK